MSERDQLLKIAKRQTRSRSGKLTVRNAMRSRFHGTGRKHVQSNLLLARIIFLNGRLAETAPLERSEASASLAVTHGLPTVTSPMRIL